MEIRVRAGHMLNSFQAPSVCRFLSEIADDGVAQLLGFDWGSATAYSFLPRLQYNRIVLSPARWRITAALRDAEITAASRGFLGRLADFRKGWNVPRYVHLAQGDNRLLLDLDNSDQAEQLRGELAILKNGEAVVMQESLPGPEHAWLEGPDGHYFTELVVPLVRRPRDRSGRHAEHQKADIDSNRQIPSISTFTRSRPPGSDWLFVKIYCPPFFQDELLVGAVRDFCDKARRSSTSNGWFYVRYSDPDPHIRIRFRGDPQTLIAKLFPDLCSWSADLIADGICQRFCFDTYDREIERYGGLEGMAGVEGIFTSDSPCAIDTIALMRSTPELDRLTVRLVSIDTLLEAAGLDDARRLDWYESRVKSPRFFGDEFRQRKNALRALFADREGIRHLPGGETLAPILKERQVSLESSVTLFKDLDTRGQLTKSFNQILESVVHMHCNRLGGSGLDNVEDKALELLLRTYKSLKAAPLAR
jgi:thiopeptide-type bacteriocin biosynthesis protein